MLIGKGSRRPNREKIRNIKEDWEEPLVFLKKRQLL